MREMAGEGIELEPFLVVEASVGPIVSLGPAPAGERRVVAILGGTVEGDGIRGEIVPGGEDWQTLRADGVLEIEAHYVVRLEDGALVEVLSQGYRHGPPEVMARLVRGEPVAADEYFFRTLMRFRTGAPAWEHLNKTLALATAERGADSVKIRAFRVL